jgi:hypothetical protein
LFVKDLRKELETNETLIVNFEDPRFPAGMDVKDLFKIYETYLKNWISFTKNLVHLEFIVTVFNEFRIIFPTPLVMGLP